MCPPDTYSANLSFTIVGADTRVRPYSYQQTFPNKTYKRQQIHFSYK